MKRDFSEDNQQTLLSTINSIEEEQVSDFANWVGFNGLAFYRWVGLLDLKQYLQNLDNYNSTVHEINKTSKAAIHRVFEEVQEADHQRSISLQQTKHHYNILKEYIKQLSDVMDVHHTPFTNDRVRSIDILNTEIIDQQQLFIIDEKGSIELVSILVKELFEKPQLADEDCEKLITLLRIIGLSDVKSVLYQKLIDAGFNEEKRKQLIEYMIKNVSSPAGGTPISLANEDDLHHTLYDLYKSTYFNNNMTLTKCMSESDDGFAFLHDLQLGYEIVKKNWKSFNTGFMDSTFDSVFAYTDLIDSSSSIVKDSYRLTNLTKDPNAQWEDYADSSLAIVEDSIDLADTIMMNPNLFKIGPTNQILFVKTDAQSPELMKLNMKLILTQVAISTIRGGIRQEKESMADGYQPKDIGEIGVSASMSGISKFIDKGTFGAVKIDGDDISDYMIGLADRYEKEGNFAYNKIVESLKEGKKIEAFFWTGVTELQALKDTAIYGVKKVINPESSIVNGGGFR